MPNSDPNARDIDLHAHTTASDGEHSPETLVAMGAEIGLTALAVTDHDTTAAVNEARSAGARQGVEVVPGIELSAEPPRTPSGARAQCHILGLLIDPDCPALLNRLDEVVRNRNTRNQRIVERMQRELGWDITLSEVEAVAGGDVIARPHFAKVMVRKGYVASVREAFDTYLGKGGRAYVERERLTAAEAIGLIHRANGLAILAHPNNLKMEPQEAENYIRDLHTLGLDGIEARYNLHTREDTARYLSLADQLGVLTSGGSDFHGLSVKPTVQLGHVENGKPAPHGLLDALHEAQKRYAR